MLTTEKLREYGADVDSGLARCMDNEEFYLKMVGMALEDAAFDNLVAALEAGDLDTAFETAHGLKGVTGNLALSPIYEPVCEITEFLRSRTEMDYSDLRDTIMIKSEELVQLSK